MLRSCVEKHMENAAGESDADVIKEINVLAGSALAICNPLCHYTKLPQGRRRWMSPAATRCCNQSDSESPAAPETTQLELLLLLLLLLELRLRLRQRRRINPSLAIRRPHRKPLREPVMNSSVPGTEVVKTPTPHKANMKEEWGNFRCLPVSFAFIEHSLSLALCLCLFLACRLQWLPHATLANQWHGTDYSIPYSVFGLRFA